MVQLLREILGEKDHSLRFRAKGTSMSPFIRDRDVITVTPVTTNTLRAGQIIAFVFQPEGKLCVHRIICRNQDGFITRGDNLAWPDSVISETQVLGRVIRVERNDRTVSAGTGMGGMIIARFWHTSVVREVVAGLKYLKSRARNK